MGILLFTMKQGYAISRPSRVLDTSPGRERCGDGWGTFRGRPYFTGNCRFLSPSLYLSPYPYRCNLGCSWEDYPHQCAEQYHFDSRSSVGLVAGTFIGAIASDSKSLHVFPIGILEGLKFMCCFRFKLWWMTQRMEKCGKDVPLETQFMLVESKEEDPKAPVIYTVFLPLLEGPFRVVLQGNDMNEIEICLESGDNTVETNQGLHLVYMHAGTNPFEVINHAVKALEKYMQTFVHREKKKGRFILLKLLPSFLDWFGWCTWDAFYTDVTAEGVEEGLRSLSEGGTPPRFLIIDDGWQQIENKPKHIECVVQEGAQ
ncbi:hypothetical protein GQ457_06G010460 [Hibiscus cannabinus]